MIIRPEQFVKQGNEWVIVNTRDYYSVPMLFWQMNELEDRYEVHNVYGNDDENMTILYRRKSEG